MAKRKGHISRRELLARGIALGGAAIAGSPTKLFGQEAHPEGDVPPAATDPLDDLRASLRGELLTSADPAYDEARKLWNGMIDKRPAAIVRCAGTADVINAVNFARSSDMAVSVRGGGHNIAGKALRNDALAIDLSPMKGVRVDPTAKTARTQGGVLWGEYDRETSTFGLGSTGGIVSTVGVAGLTLGGGIGWLMRKHGLACDNLISVDIVTADGRFLTASESENADLFWAVRGGGGNFGVVTSFEFRLHELETITAGATFYPFAMTKDVLRFFRDYTSSAPDSVSTQAGVMNGLKGSPMAGEKVAWIAACHSGPESEGERLLRPIKEFGPPVMDLIGVMPYTTLQSMFTGEYPPGNRNYWRSNFLTELSDEIIDIVVTRSEGLPPTAGSTSFFEHMQGAVGRVGEQDTAFSNRAAKFNFTVIGVWKDSGEDAKNIKWTRDFGDAIKPLATGAGYVNYMMHDEGAARVRATYEVNYKRLVAVKRKYDPTNFFSGNQNITP